MTKQELLNYCAKTYGTIPDCPFENDFDTTPPAPDFKIQFIDEALLPIIPAASIKGF